MAGMERLWLLARIGLAGGCALLASACGSSFPTAAAGGTSASAAPPSSSAIDAPPPTVASPRQLLPARFPSTTDGKLARDICEQWARLRAEYYSRVQQDTAYQLNQWFSSSQWAREDTDSMQLGGDPDYSNIETAFGAGLVGDLANVASARQIDRACSAGD